MKIHVSKKNTSLGMVLLTAIMLSGCGKSGDVLDQAAWRDTGIPSDGIVYIEDEMVGLTVAPTELSSMVAEVVSLVNKERVGAGLKALTVDNALTADAMQRATEISVKFSHTRPSGQDWYTLDPNNMYGENLAKGYITADSTVKAWMNSPAHKDNILYKDFAKVGAAMYIADNGEYYWAIEFGYNL